MNKIFKLWGFFLWFIISILPSSIFGMEKILILKLESNKLSAQEKEKYLTFIREKLQKYKKFEILKSPILETMEFLFEMNCIDIDQDCMTRIGKSRNADFVLYTEINIRDGKYEIRLQLTNVKKEVLGNPIEGEAPSLDKIEEYLNKSLEGVFGPEPKPKPTLAEVRVRTTPAGAEVYIDGDYAGITPSGTLKLKIGKHTLKISKVGYQEIIESFEVTSEKPLTLNYSLKEVIVQKPIKKPEEKVVTLTEEEPFYTKWWFWTIVGVVAAGGGAGIHFLVKGKGVGETGNINLSLDPYLADKDPAVLKLNGGLSQ